MDDGRCLAGARRRVEFGLGEGWEVAADADALDQWAGRAWAEHGTNLKSLADLPPAVASRVLRLAAADAGARNLGRERTAALCALAGVGTEKSKSAGPVQLEGKISAYRRSPVIVFTDSR